MKLNRTSVLVALSIVGVSSLFLFQNFTNYATKAPPGCEASVHSSSGKMIYRCFNQNYNSGAADLVNQTYDLYLPAHFDADAPTLYPMVVHLHGDQWRGEKGDDAGFAENLAAIGYVVANLNFASASQPWSEKFNATLDIQSFIRLISTSAFTGANKVDLTKIFLTGFATGGHLALMEATRGDFQYYGVLVKSAPTQIDKMLDSSDPAFKSILFDTFGGSYSFREKMSPYNRVGKLKTAYLYMEHSQTDTLVPFTQASDFFAAASAPEKVENFVAGDPINTHQDGYIIGSHNFSEGSKILETLEQIYNERFNNSFSRKIASFRR